MMPSSQAERPYVSSVQFSSYQQEIRCRAAYCYLMGHAAGHPQDEYLAKLLAATRAGLGVLSDTLGLTPQAFTELMARHFPTAHWRYTAQGASIDRDRAPECDDLRTLMVSHGHEGDPAMLWSADILVAGCMGSDHLWQDMGFWSRQELSAFIQINFACLFEKNDRNMKWKKFFYKQLCAQEGLYICRAPSCEVCVDYADCFGPE